ncbi:hypothetical protein B0H10DRAFT_1944449 [Mycena sp. CBHHK59/15]|nr:hypothetical protein B0H10DRAFT_1944449 [Mycena sp. CBHHK59/15]
MTFGIHQEVWFKTEATVHRDSGVDASASVRTQTPEIKHDNTRNSSPTPRSAKAKFFGMTDATKVAFRRSLKWRWISASGQSLSSANGGARIAATTHLQRQLPAVTQLHPTLAAAILAPPSALDKPSALYIFDILADQPNHRTCHTLAQAQIWMAKIGHSKHPWKHWAQWLWKCRGQRQDWWAYWNVPYAAKFEALIHLHFKLLGAWMLPSECHFCGIRHTEKFGFRACGGRAGIARVIVFYLRRLGWPVDEKFTQKPPKHEAASWPRKSPKPSKREGVFKLELFLPEGYPMVPLKVRFLTLKYHPIIVSSISMWLGPPIAKWVWLLKGALKGIVQAKRRCKYAPAWNHPPPKPPPKKSDYANNKMRGMVMKE